MLEVLNQILNLYGVDARYTVLTRYIERKYIYVGNIRHD